MFGENTTYSTCFETLGNPNWYVIFAFLALPKQKNISALCRFVSLESLQFISEIATFTVFVKQLIAGNLNRTTFYRCLFD